MIKKNKKCNVYEKILTEEESIYNQRWIITNEGIELMNNKNNLDINNEEIQQYIMIRNKIIEIIQEIEDVYQKLIEKKDIIYQNLIEENKENNNTREIETIYNQNENNDIKNMIKNLQNKTNAVELEINSMIKKYEVPYIKMYQVGKLEIPYTITEYIKTFGVPLDQYKLEKNYKKITYEARSKSLDYKQ